MRSPVILMTFALLASLGTSVSASECSYEASGRNYPYFEGKDAACVLSQSVILGQVCNQGHFGDHMCVKLNNRQERLLEVFHPTLGHLDCSIVVQTVEGQKVQCFGHNFDECQNAAC